MSSLKLTPGDKQFLHALKVDVGKDVLPDWRDYAHALERESLLTAYLKNDQTEIRLLTERLAHYQAEIAKFSDENFGLWVVNLAEAVLIGALLCWLLRGWLT